MRVVKLKYYATYERVWQLDRRKDLAYFHKVGNWIFHIAEYIVDSINFILLQVDAFRKQKEGLPLSFNFVVADKHTPKELAHSTALNKEAIEIVFFGLSSKTTSHFSPPLCAAPSETAD